MHFSFVDRILELEPGKRVLAVKHVTADEPFLEMRGGRAALVTCIIGEALGQAGAWSVMAANDFTKRPVAGVVAEVELLGEAFVGDTILLDTTIDSIADDAVVYHSVGTVRGRTVFALRDGLGPLLPMEQFNDPADVREHFRLLNRPGRFEEAPEGGRIPADAPETNPFVRFDRIVSIDEKEAVAVKNLTIRSPYFRDHFQRKPVLPLSLLLEMHLQLGRKLMPGKRPSRLRNVKMSDWVPPGSSLVGRVRVKEPGVLAIRSEVEGKRVCIAEAEFTA